MLLIWWVNSLHSVIEKNNISPSKSLLSRTAMALLGSCAASRNLHHQSCNCSSEMPWQECLYEDRGDEALVIIPPTISVARLVYPIPDRLLSLIRRLTEYRASLPGSEYAWLRTSAPSTTTAMVS